MRTRWHIPAWIVPACLFLLRLSPGHCSNSLLSPADTQYSHDEYAGKTNVNVDLTRTHPVSDKLYGVFFEEIGHAGEGGIYAELVQDRGFEALAFTTGFLDSQEQTLPLTAQMLAPQTVKAPMPKHTDLSQIRSEVAQSQRFSNSVERLAQQPKSWFPLTNTSAALTKLQPLNSANGVAMNLSTTTRVGGIINTGYWGIPVKKGKSYHFSVHVLDPLAMFKNESLLRVALVSKDGKETHASATIGDIKTKWQRFTANLTSSATDDTAQLRITFPGPSTLLVDVVSLFPAENVVEGYVNPWPFREDLVQMLKDLRPRFLRVPGGCVVEGNILKEAFNWKRAIGPNAIRPGHWDLWGYWNTDGLGMFEYLLLAEELDADAVWVANNGVSHTQSVAPQDLGPWLQDALDSLEFAMGDEWTPWGSIRKEMGRVKPFSIKYFAIGNEDCGKPWYVENYRIFFNAIRDKYPDIALIANCDLQHPVLAPEDDFDWHIYTTSWDLINQQHAFDNLVPGQGGRVFASEYATVADGGWGNLRGALAEATFMTGMERNSEVVHMAAYAPLFTNTNDHWWQTNLIMFNGTEVYGIPSYYVQKLFSRYQGVSYAPSTAASDTSLVHNDWVAASSTCQDTNCTHLAVKVVNNGDFRQLANVTLTGVGGATLNSTARADIITGDFPEIENNLQYPKNVYPREEHLTLHTSNAGSNNTAAFSFSLPPISVVILHLHLDWHSSSPPPIVSRAQSTSMTPILSMQ